ncbi:MAG: ATP-binding protein [Methylophilaceae bacterium]
MQNLPENNNVTTSSIRTAGVDMSGLMMVLGQHLYSTPMVALRELVQNAHDSTIRRRIENPEANHGNHRIRVEGDLNHHIVRVTDCGAGMTEQEVHTYLATVGTGYTRKLRTESQSDELIGMFGLGFLSAFVLAKRVTVTSTSWQTPNETWRYQSNNGEKYTLTPAPLAPIGTVVELELHPKHSHLAAQGMLKRVLERYCSLLTVPVIVGDDEAALNNTPPPWRSNQDNVVPHAIQARKNALAFAARFENRFEPICTMTVNANDGTDLMGLLWVQDGASYGTSDNRNLSVFVRGMLLDDDARDLLPPWAGFIGGVIESKQLTPTASREDLQRDDAYEAAQTAICNALITGLAEVAKQQPQAWRRVIARHNEALLGASLCDPRLFELLADAVTLPTSQGDMSASALRHKGVMHVNLNAAGGFEDMLFRALKVPVARGDRYAVHPFLRQWVETHGGTLIELGTEQGNQKIFTQASLPADEIAWLTEHLSDKEQVTPAYFEPAELPLVVVFDREAELKRRIESDESDKRISIAALSLARQYTANIDNSAPSRLYINMNNSAIQDLLNAYRNKHPQAAEAASILRAVKALLASNVTQGEAPDLNGALKKFGEIIQSIVTVKK